MLRIDFKVKELTHISSTYDFFKKQYDGKYILKFESDGVETIITLNDIDEVKAFLFYLYNAETYVKKLGEIKRFIDPDKRKDE